MTRPIVVFDLDGTLIDTAPDLLDSVNHCLDISGLERVAPDQLRGLVGHGARVMIERAFTLRGHALSDARLDELLEVFIAHYTSNMPGRSQPYAGVAEAMDRFADAGYALAVCTNKLESLALRLIGDLGLTPRFAAIAGGDTFAHRKPDPRHLTDTIGLAGGAPDRALMVGDSSTDIETAKAAGIPVVAVDFGYTERHVSCFGPSQVISHYDELTVAMAERLMAG